MNKIKLLISSVIVLPTIIGCTPTNNVFTRPVYRMQEALEPFKDRTVGESANRFISNAKTAFKESFLIISPSEKDSVLSKNKELKAPEDCTAHEQLSEMQQN